MTRVISATNGWRLPNEIIIKILSYLSSSDLLILYKDNSSEELKTLLSDRDILRKIDFCRNENTETIQTVASFLKLHSKHVEKVCLNSLYCKSSFPHSAFQTFKNLSELHVKNCSFSVSCVLSILPTVKTLKVFSWSMVEIEREDLKEMVSVLKTGVKISPKLRRLNIDAFLHDEQGLLIIISLFCNISYLEINAYKLRYNPGLHGINLNKLQLQYTRKLFPHLNSFVFNIIIGKYDFSKDNLAFPAYSSICQWLLERRPTDLPWEVFQIWEMYPNNDKNEGKREVQSCAKPSAGIFIPSMKLSCPKDWKYLTDIVERNAGELLQYLTFTNCLVEPEHQLKIVEFFRSLTTSCCNLVDINITGTHFSQDQGRDILRIIAEIHDVRRLAIPACIVPHVEVEICSTRKRKMSITPLFVEPKNTFTKPVLEYLVKNCPNLVELDIRSENSNTVLVQCSCGNSQGSCKDSDLEPISRLRNLQYLTLCNLPGVYKMPFIRTLPLLSLRLRSIGPQGHCLFWNSLQEAFGALTTLQELSLEHSRLPLDKLLFWNPFKKLISLKRLCIISNFDQLLQPMLIVDVLGSVPSVRTLHIHSKATNFKGSSKAMLS